MVGIGSERENNRNIYIESEVTSFFGTSMSMSMSSEGVRKTNMRAMVLIICVIFMIIALHAAFTTTAALSLPTATNFGIINDTESACCDMSVAIPVTITNLENGPVAAIIFNILYNNSVMRVVGVHNGALTANWENPTYKNFNWGTRVAMVTKPPENEMIPDGANGSVALLVFNVTGEPGSWSTLSFSDIQLAEGPPDYQIGTAPAKSGIFTVVPCSLKGRVTDVVGTGIEGATVNLTLDGVSIASTSTDIWGNYWFSFAELPPGVYNLSVTKKRFWLNRTTVTINPDESTRADITLLLVGDLNNNGKSADILDVSLMWNAWANLIPKDFRYDLNHDGVEAEIEDVALMWNAWMGEIVLE